MSHEKWYQDLLNYQFTQGDVEELDEFVIAA